MPAALDRMTSTRMRVDPPWRGHRRTCSGAEIRKQRLRQRMSLAALTLGTLLAMVVASFHEVRAEMSAPSQDTQYLQYFLDRTPANIDGLPPAAQDVIVAKVRLVGLPAWTGGRDQSGQPPPVPEYFFAAGVKIIEVLTGKAVPGEEYVVNFGSPVRGTEYKIPHTPRQLTRDYFIVSYVEKDSVRRLLAFPVSREEFLQWHDEVTEHERLRGRPGARDP